MSDDIPLPSSSFAPLPAGARSSIHRDVMAAYVAAGVRIGAWAVVSAIVYRLAGPAHFAMLALIRGTIGILNYTAVGLSPALIRLFALAHARSPNPTGSEPPADERIILSTALVVATASAVIGFGVTALYAHFINRLHAVPVELHRQAPLAVILIGAGTLFRLFSDTYGAALQIRGRIALDNLLAAGSDLFWVVATGLLYHWPGLLSASAAYAAAGAFLVVARRAALYEIAPGFWPGSRSTWRWEIARRLLAFGALVLISQLAEYFYAPTDYILINHFFGPAELAAYAPGVQIDMGLLMLVTALAAVLLPRSALAHARGANPLLRRYYTRGTILSTTLLFAAALVVWLSYPLIFRTWFGPHPPATGVILDLVLIGTVVGGSSAVGRSILIGMGKVGPFTAAALIAGVVNVVASYCFVRFAGLGLRGILYGTLIAVIGRCGLWMPWYVLRTLRDPLNNFGPGEVAARTENLR